MFNERFEKFHPSKYCARFKRYNVHLNGLRGIDHRVRNRSLGLIIILIALNIHNSLIEYNNFVSNRENLEKKWAKFQNGYWTRLHLEPYMGKTSKWPVVKNASRTQALFENLKLFGTKIFRANREHLWVSKSNTSILISMLIEMISLWTMETMKQTFIHKRSVPKWFMMMPITVSVKILDFAFVFECSN